MQHASLTVYIIQRLTMEAIHRVTRALGRKTGIFLTPIGEGSIVIQLSGVTCSRTLALKSPDQ